MYSKYTRVVPLKDKKRITITNALKKIQINQNTNQIKYGFTKTMNFTIEINKIIFAG